MGWRMGVPEWDGRSGERGVWGRLVGVARGNTEAVGWRGERA